MASYEKKRARDIDYIYARYPLWIRYSGLPRQLGPVTWAVFQRLLELRERFESRTFYYALERLAETSGIKNRRNMCSILDRLVQDGLINYTTTQGRGKATEFEILEPLHTPLPEEDVYRVYPRLASKSYNKKLRDAIDAQEKGTDDPLLGGEKEIRDPPIKKIYIKRQQQQKDLFHDTVDSHPGADQHQPPAGPAVVVALTPETLKKYGIAGEQAAACLKKYSSAYLLEKIEIMEYKRYCGEQVRNPGVMLKKAIEEDWQPPEGFCTRAQREENARRELAAQETAARAAAEKEMQVKREQETEKLVEAWKLSAQNSLREEVREQARGEVAKENPGTDERWLKPLIRIRESRIIAEDYVEKEKMEMTRGH